MNHGRSRRPKLLNAPADAKASLPSYKYLTLNARHQARLENQNANHCAAVDKGSYEHFAFLNHANWFCHLTMSRVKTSIISMQLSSLKPLEPDTAGKSPLT